MKVTLWMAISLNGIIAKDGGNEDFLSHDNWIAFSTYVNKIGCLIWGRKTYENVKTWDVSYLRDLANVKKIIISHNGAYMVDRDFILATSPKDALDKAKNEECNGVVLTGGSTNNSAFAREGLINEVIVNIEPVMVGKGIPLFKSEDFFTRLNLVDIQKRQSGIVQLHYITK